MQARGPEGRIALEAIEYHRVRNDSEELITLDDKWDEWFEDEEADKEKEKEEEEEAEKVPPPLFR